MLRVIAPLPASAWRLACRLFPFEEPIFEILLDDEDRSAIARLGELHAVLAYNQGEHPDVLCPNCMLKSARVEIGPSGLTCRCPDCGRRALRPEDLRAWVFNLDWLVRALREALSVSADHPPVPIMTGMWRIGFFRECPVFLARRPESVLTRPSALRRVRERGQSELPWLITPKPPRELDADPFGGLARWLPLEECFVFRGERLEFMGSLAAEFGDNDPHERRHPTYGPFSHDFRSVRLDDWPNGEIQLTEAQGAIFQALWSLQGKPCKAETVMDKAGLASQKPADLFKIKKANKGDPRYEGPLHAYRVLVVARQRAGTYAIRSAQTSINAAG